MSVLLVTDDADDDIQTESKSLKHEYLYQQIKELEYDYSSLESSLSIAVNPNSDYRQYHPRHLRRRRRYRAQQCLVKHLLTYMLTLLFLTNHLHWSVILLSLSSIKFMSTYASTTTTPPPPPSSPILSPSTTSTMIQQDEQQCLLFNSSHIDRLCSKTCRAQKTPFEKLASINDLLLDMHYLPFCSNNSLNHSINQTNFFDETTENQCREILYQLMSFDDEARKASALFATYIQSIDSASKENRYSIIDLDCQHAYQTWACSVKIPFFHGNHLIPPCQTICDEVERVCPTFRPSDDEPLFAGQPLFFCDGGIVANSDYNQRPHCFDTCHISGGSLQRPSASSSSSNQSFYPKSPSAKLIESIVTTPRCYDIEPLVPPSPSEDSSSSLLLPLSIDDLISNQTSNASLSASAISIISSAWSSIIVNILTFIFVLLLRILQEL